MGRAFGSVFLVDSEIRLKPLLPGSICFEILDRMTPTNLNSVSLKNFFKEQAIPGRCETAVRVAMARIVIADYPLIRKDFPQIKNCSSAEIDQFLLDQCAFISEAQTKQTQVNTKIQTTPEKKQVFRARDSGRGFCIPVGQKFIDAKGVGARAPQKRDHQNGLATLGEVLREFLFQKMVEEILFHSRTGYKTVESYAVIHFDFRVKEHKFSGPAGALLRKFHTPSSRPGTLMDKYKTMEIERVLRTYGVTSAGAYRNKFAYDKMNIQETLDHRIKDFGAFLVVDKLTRPVNFYHEAPVMIFDPKDANFPQPLKRLQIPNKVWGLSVDGLGTVRQDWPWVKSAEIAESFAGGRCSRQEVQRFYDHFLKPVQKKLRKK